MVCLVCGKQFVPNTSRQLLCGSEECSAERKRQWNRQNWEAKKKLQIDDEGVLYTEPPVVRKCLRCDRPFKSHGFRLCPKCHHVNFYVSESGLDGLYK